MTNIEIQSITLLSKNEYQKYKSIIPFLKAYWWLRTPGNYSNFACNVYGGGDVGSSYYVYDTSIGVRPVLTFSNLESKPGDKIERFDYTWTVLDDSIALCDSIIEYHRFDKKNNDWESSELKAWLENWLKERQEEELVATGSALGIKRAVNGKQLTFALTPDEIRTVYEAEKRRLLVGEIRSQCTQDGKSFSDEDIEKIADSAQAILNGNDSWWEAYWLSIQEACDNYTSVH